MWKIWEKWKGGNLAYFFPWLIVVWSWKKDWKWKERVSGCCSFYTFALACLVCFCDYYVWACVTIEKVGHDVDIWARPISAQKVPESELVYWTRDLLRASANNIPTDLFQSNFLFLLIFSIKNLTCVKKVYITNKLYMSL
jgi:hypothetical protein